MLDPRPGWWSMALCSGISPDVFFAGRIEPKRTRLIRSACRSCPVRGACVASALPALPNGRVPDGWFGGLTTRDRRVLRRDGVVEVGGDVVLVDGGVVTIAEGSPVLPPGEARAVLEALSAVHVDRRSSERVPA